MAGNKEIDSTEKLLKLIRDEKKPTSDHAESPSSSQNPPRTPKISAIPMQKKFTVGVDIGHTYIKLAKLVHRSEKNFELVDYLTIKPKWSFTQQDAKFQELLRDALDQICGEDRRHAIWSAIPSAQVETRCLRIPKLPRKQIPNAIFWTFTKMVDFNEAEEILDYEILGDVLEQGVKKTEVMTFKAPRKDVADLKAAFNNVGYPLSGITIVPFAIQNLFRSNIVPYHDQEICSLFVGRDWSRIAIYSKGDLVLTRGIKAGMQSMVEAIHLALQNPNEWTASSKEGVTESQDKNQRTSFIHPKVQKLFFEFIGSSEGKTSTDQTTDGKKPAKVFQMLLPALERLIRQVERTLEHYMHTYHREGIQHLLLSGQVTANALLVNHIGRQLDLPITVLNPFAPETSFAQNVQIPSTQDERESYAPAIGLGLSTNASTPNILFTHQDKNRIEAVRRINMRILTGCLICLIVLIGFFSWQERRLDEKRDEVNKLNEQLSIYQPPAEKEIILSLYARTKDKRQTFNRVVSRYAPVAVIKELSQITPANIRLLSIAMSPTPSRTDKPAKEMENDGIITLDGIAFGGRETLEAILTSYLLELKNSPIFQKPEIQNRQLEYYNEQQVLHFKVKLVIV